VCAACGFVLYLGPKVAAGTVPLLDGGFVLIRRGVEPRAGYWSFPCGFVESDETVEHAAVRETREECGLAVELDGRLGVYSYPQGDHAPQGLVIVPFVARVVGGVLAAGDDATEARVVSQAEIPWDDLAFQSSHAALRALLARLRG
jgi:ADP-ribose pyrophosphatase YjhB (NUDIX family)